MSPRVVSLRRYPVKSMAGESLAVAHLVTRGISGDRIFAVRDTEQRLASGHDTERLVRHDGVFDFAARTEGRRVVIGDARGRIGDAGHPAVDKALTTALGVDVRIAHETDIPHIDEGAVSLIGTATLAWCASQWGVDADPRRLRVNMVVDTSEPFEEEGWVGSMFTTSGIRLSPSHRIPRQRSIDLAQNGVETTTQWLEPLERERGGRLGVCCDVAARGPMAVNDSFSVDRPANP